MANSSGTIVSARDIRHRYGGVLALDGISLDVEKGSFTAILGPNGAGKSTLAQVLSGLLKPTSGSLHYDEVPANASFNRGLVRYGICLIPEGRRLFGQLTVEENLIVAGHGAGLDKAGIRRLIPKVADILPKPLLDGMTSRVAMSLSGGERQILALSRALMCNPRLIVIDEPSMGLAPIMVDRVYDVLTRLNAEGAAVIVVEQIATHAVTHARNLYVLSRGRIAYEGPTAGQAAANAIQRSYVGHS